jgi:hypothetical protein
MSYFDERMIEITDQRNPSPVVATVNTVLGDGTPGASPGGAIGVVLIAGGVVGTLATGGAAWPLGLFGVVAGLLMLGGNKTVEHNIERMDTAAQESPEAVTEAAQIGFIKLIAYCVVGGAVLVGLFLALAMLGEISGVTI